MRTILAITLALMIAAVLLMPVMGYTIKSAGNQSYTFTSGPRVNYSISSGIVAHNLTQEMIIAKVAISPSVTTTRVPYSFKLEGTSAAMAPAVTITGKETTPVEAIGKEIKPVMAVPINETAPVTPSVVETAPIEAVPVNETAPVTPPVVETAPIEAVPVNETATIEATHINETAGMLSIQGMVADEINTGLADWTVVLENSDGTITNTTTALDGIYAFNNLSPGAYIISEELKVGWELVPPMENQISINLTESITGQNFVNKMVQVSTNETATTAP
ncbi:MAG: hypothetical protein MUO26_00985 [Methanotrichaceae archaeon]|nr:hypothetical protein [Methanotrichaceae archaeon]